MLGDHTKKMVIGGEKTATSHGKALSRESANKKKDGSCGGQISPGSTRRIKDLTKGPKAP
jgi:hypothetical protein